MSEINILIVDESPIIKNALFALTQSTFQTASIDASENWMETQKTLGQRRYDLIVMSCSCGHNLRTYGASFVDLAAPSPVVIFGGWRDRATVLQTQQAGLRGFIPATTTPELFSAALQLILAGGDYYPLMPIEEENLELEDRQRLIRQLTDRQHEVFLGLANAESNGEIARRLGVSLATVKLEVRSLLRFIGARNRTEAVLKAREIGI